MLVVPSIEIVKTVDRYIHGIGVARRRVVDTVEVQGLVNGLRLPCEQGFRVSNVFLLTRVLTWNYGSPYLYGWDVDSRQITRRTDESSAGCTTSNITIPVQICGTACPPSSGRVQAKASMSDLSMYFRSESK